MTSSSAPVNHGLFGRDLSHNTIFGLNIDTVGTVSAGVFQLDVVFSELAVDQQQEVDRSRYAEFFVVSLFAWVQCYCVERETQSIGKPDVIFRQGVLAGGPPFGKVQEPQPGQHSDAVIRFLGFRCPEQR